MFKHLQRRGYTTDQAEIANRVRQAGSGKYLAQKP